MRSLRELSDRQIIRIALILWALIAISSLITNTFDFTLSAIIAIALGGYGLRVIRKREKN